MSFLAMIEYSAFNRYYLSLMEFCNFVQASHVMEAVECGIEGSILQLVGNFHFKILDLFYLSKLCILEYEWIENNDMKVRRPNENKIFHKQLSMHPQCY